MEIYTSDSKLFCARCKQEIKVGQRFTRDNGLAFHDDMKVCFAPAVSGVCPDCIAPTMPYGTCHSCGRKWGECVPGTLTGVLKFGVKHDDGKLRYDLVPFRALQGMVGVLTHGAKKYAPDNWRFVDNVKSRYVAALFRHLVPWLLGEKLDPDSGLPHLDHLACDVFFLSELEKDGKL